MADMVPGVEAKARLEKRDNILLYKRLVVSFYILLLLQIEVMVLARLFNNKTLGKIDDSGA